MRKASTCPRATQDVESARGTHWVGRTAPLAVPCRDNSAIPRQTGSLLSQLRSSAFVGPRLSALGILGEAARSGSARHAAGRCTAISRPPEPPGACIRAWPHDHDSRKRPSRLAITDNGSGRVGCGPPAWARLYCIHIQSCGFCRSRLWPWSSRFHVFGFEDRRSGKRGQKFDQRSRRVGILAGARHARHENQVGLQAGRSGLVQQLDLRLHLIGDAKLGQ